MRSIATSFKRLKRNVRVRFFGDIPVFVILLESDQDRCLHVHMNVLPKLPICDVVSATSAAKGDLDNFLSEEKLFLDIDASIAPGKIACSISHMRAWKAIIAQDLRDAIILEDDVAIRDGFSSFMRKLKRQLPVNFDMVHLYVSENRSEWLRLAATTKEAYVNYIPLWGRSAYLLSRSGAEKLLSGFRTITAHGDRQISEMAQKGRLLVYCASESYVNNLGQLTWQYNGERFRSTTWPLSNSDISQVLEVGDKIALPLKTFKTKTGELQGDVLECVPEKHTAGHALYGPDYVIFDHGIYCAVFVVAQDDREVAGDVVFDVYENRRTNRVLAEARLDGAGERKAVALEFCARQGYSIELRIYWPGKSRLRVIEICLERRA
jgi:GR25 family glycosyltransferase involved in LPS biosynthesis